LHLVLIIENIQVGLLVDRNMDDPTLPDDPELVVMYGKLLYIAHVTLPRRIARPYSEWSAFARTREETLL
jgi:hypothetical protein